MDYSIKILTINNNYKLLLIALISRILIFISAYFYMNGINFPYGLCQWDCGWYLSIINNGYDLYPHGYPHGNVANWSFFPLFPVLVSIIKLVIPLNSIIIALLLNNIIFLIFIQLLYIYAKPMLGKLYAYKGATAFCFFPFTLYLSIPYSESLYLVLLLSGLVLINKKKYWQAVIFGMLLAITRNGGIFFIIIFIAHYITTIYIKKDSKIETKQIIKLLLGVLCIPILFEIFTLYLYLKTGDALAFVHIQRGYGRLVGSNPLTTLDYIFRYPDPYSVYCLIALFIGILSCIWLIKRKFISEAIFSLLPLCLTLYTGNISGMSRYSFLSLSFIIFFVYLYSKIKLTYYLIGILFMASISMLFVYFWVFGYSYMI